MNREILREILQQIRSLAIDMKITGLTINDAAEYDMDIDTTDSSILLRSDELLIEEHFKKLYNIELSFMQYTSDKESTHCIHVEGETGSPIRMDEREACLTSVVMANRSDFDRLALLEADAVYAVNTSVDQASSVVLGYRDEEDDAELNRLAINNMERHRHSPVRHDPYNLDDSEVKPSGFILTDETPVLPVEEAMASSMVKEALAIVNEESERRMLRALIGVVILTGKSIGISVVRIRSIYPYAYKMQLLIRQDSQLSKEDESVIATMFKEAYNLKLTFIQSFTHDSNISLFRKCLSIIIEPLNALKTHEERQC